MVNPKDFQATPWSHNAKVDKSGPNKNLSAHGRPEASATSMDHFKPTPKSGEGYKAFGHGGTNMGMPNPMSSDRKEMKPSGMSMPSKIDKSEPKVPAEPAKWHKRGYNMGDGAHMSMEQAKKFNMKEKAR
jgi:hypothetical protein